MAEQSSTGNLVLIASVSLPKKILVPVDGSEESFAAARYAIELAEKMKAELSPEPPREPWHGYTRL